MISNIKKIIEQTPPEHLALPRYHHLLARAFRERYMDLGDLNDLTASLQSSKAAVELTTQEHPSRAGYLHNLAILLTDRYQRLGDLKDLEVALQKNQEVVDLTPDGHPNRAHRLASLAISLTDRYQRLGNLEDLEASLQKFQEVVGLTPQEHPDRGEHLHHLAVSFGNRYKRLGNLKDLELALQTDQEAVNMTPEGHPNKRGCLRSLAVTFSDRYQRLGDLEDLEASLQNSQAALEMIPEGHPERARCLEGLAVSFRDRYCRLGDLRDLEASLQSSQAALGLTPEGHPDRPGCLQVLGVSLTNRYERLGDLKDLDTLSQIYQEALDLIPKGHPDRVQLLQNLSLSFVFRYESLGDLSDLKVAQQMLQEVLNLTPEGHPDRSGRLKVLALSFRYQYERLGDLRDLENALHLASDAVQTTPEEHPDLAGQLQNLALLLMDRYERLGDTEDLLNALQIARRVVYMTPEEHPDLAGRLQNFAIALSFRYRKFREPADLEAAHTHYDASFQLTSSRPQLAWEQAFRWAALAEEFQPSHCVSAYRAAFNMLPEIIWIGLSIPARHGILHRVDITLATSTAVRACLNLHNLISAIEIMEQGLATIFQQMLQLRTDVDHLRPDLAENFRNLSAQLYTSPRSLRLVNERQELLKEIRKEPGLEYFLLPKPYSVLRRVSQGGPVVILTSHKDHCDSIIILSPTSEPVRILLPDVTLSLLQSQQEMLKELLDHSNIRLRGQSSSSRLFGRRERYSSKSTQECFAEMLNWLWTHVVGPVYEALKLRGIYNGRLWWLPTGAFAGLPLHASPQMDQFIHSYTATLGLLLDAYAKQTSNTEPKFSIVGVTHTGPGGRNSLKGVKLEVEKILSIIKKPHVQCLEGTQATVDAVKHQLQDCSWAHLACHGSQNLEDPTKSHLLLYGGILELETILRMPLSNAQVVFLAACQTAMGDTQLVNESFHLGGGFIAAGFRGAIGTLWSMNDADGPLVAEILYTHLYRGHRQPQASDAAEALSLAIQELKTRKVPYERWIPFIHMGV
ncbi:CHAT domain-containing protein [Mycena capillaripes]|nr:CHAT domain-containing protein [Mycena capillaripes]